MLIIWCSLTGINPWDKKAAKNGGITKDYVYVLKHEEAVKYCKMIHADFQRWWLRTPDGLRDNYLFNDQIDEDWISSAEVTKLMPVRPVMWIEFDAEASQQSRNVPSYTELKQGKNGTEVLKMKERLQALGYFSRGANISDKYNVTTTERVKLFQKVNGLKQTGVADEDTLMLLFSDAAKENPN